MRQELKDLMQESCNYINDNHNEVFNFIFHEDEISSTDELMEKYGASILEDNLLKHYVNNIYDTLYAQHQLVPTEIKSDAVKSIEFIKEAQQKITSIANNIKSSYIERSDTQDDESRQIRDFLQRIETSPHMKRKFIAILSEQDQGLLGEISDSLLQTKTIRTRSKSPELPGIEVTPLVKTK